MQPCPPYPHNITMYTATTCQWCPRSSCQGGIGWGYCVLPTSCTAASCAAACKTDPTCDIWYYNATAGCALVNAVDTMKSQQGAAQAMSVTYWGGRKLVVPPSDPSTTSCLGMRDGTVVQDNSKVCVQGTLQSYSKANTRFIKHANSRCRGVNWHSWNAKPHSTASVSYTHLTLPTILLV